MQDFRKVLVIGDPAIDQLLLRQPRSPGETEFDWQRYPRYTFWEVPGGVALTEKVLRELDFVPAITEVPLIGPDGQRRILKTLSRLAAAEIDGDGACTGLLSEDEQPKPKEQTNGEPQFHLRVREYQGYFPTLDNCNSSGQQEATTAYPEQVPLLFLNDAGGVARSMPNGLSMAGVCGTGTVILHKMHLPLDLTSPMVRAVANAPSKAKVLVVTASDLRADGLRLRASLSWPMFIEDLSIASRIGVLDQARKVFRHVVVLVGEDGVFALGPDDSLMMAYDAGAAEGEHDGDRDGDVYGKTNAFACALLKAATATDDFRLDEQVLARALQTVRTYSTRCLTVSSLEGDTLPSLPKVSALEEPTGLKVLRSTLDAEFVEPSLEDTVARAKAHVRMGISALSDMEHARIGTFLTVDRAEMEGFRTIRKVIDAYIDEPSLTMPLSLAVFGPPGSGKSFGIKQLVEKRKKEVEFRVFNLSEASADALPGYFHEMRDVNLKGKVPIWFFDEFDSRGCDLVARFLAPMQDGEMRDGSRLHPIGRGILVFAGGTAFTAQEFARGKGTPDEARSLKIPDFVSRLAGIIDIRGINQVKSAGGPPDTAYILRRAILLRSLLKKHRKDIVGNGPDELRIQDDLLTAFLLANEFTHGARSMEKIVQAGALQGPRPIFGGSDLPEEGLLGLHLKDSKAFLAMATGRSS